MCPDCTEDSEWERRGGDGDDDGLDQVREQQASGGLRRSKRFVRRPSVQTETKYIELMVVNDNDMVSSTSADGCPSCMYSLGCCSHLLTLDEGGLKNEIHLLHQWFTTFFVLFTP